MKRKLLKWKEEWHYYSYACDMAGDKRSIFEFLRFQFPLYAYPFAFVCKLTGKHKWKMESGGDAESGPITYAWCDRCGHTNKPIFGL